MIAQERFITDVRLFTEAVGCTVDRFNVRQTALYIGLQLEEMAEKLDAVFPQFVGELVLSEIRALSSAFKCGALDAHVENADRAAMLDADIDLAWVTIGSALSQGADVDGACREVARANLAKLVACDEQHLGTDRPLIDCPKCGGHLMYAVKDGNGKVTKPAGWRAPDLTPFVRKDGAA